MPAVQSAQNDSPPSVQRGPATPMFGIAGAVPAAWTGGPSGAGQAVSASLTTVQDRAAHLLNLERVLDSQTLTSNVPVSLVVRMDDAARDLVSGAQRPLPAAGLKLLGVRPLQTEYEQPAPTATATATATATVPFVAVATATTPPIPSPTAVPPDTATPQPVMHLRATATAEPVAASTATRIPVAPALATAVPTVTAGVFVQAGVIPSPTAPPAPTPAPVPAATSTPIRSNVTVGGMPANAQSFRITGYLPTGNRTATGTWPHWGTVAVDPSVIPLGSTVYIQGLGVFHAEDTGGAVLGRHVDVFVYSLAEANAITGYRTVGWVPPSR